LIHGNAPPPSVPEDGITPMRGGKGSSVLAKGTVEAVNAERGVFIVRCDAGPFAYFRVRAEELPPVGARVECNETVKPFPRELRVASAEDQPIRVLSGILGLPREVAFGLVSP
jgi:hypothetical protein